jgi:hypothetical protein
MVHKNLKCSPGTDRMAVTACRQERMKASSSDDGACHSLHSYHQPFISRLRLIMVLASPSADQQLTQLVKLLIISARRGRDQSRAVRLVPGGRGGIALNVIPPRSA